MKKVMEGIVDYYQEYFNLPLSEFGKPDPVKIGKHWVFLSRNKFFI